MAKGNDVDERLAVGSPDGANSVVFKIWSPIGKSDVYASIREHASVFKVSLHDRGICVAGLTKQFAMGQSGAIAQMGGSRLQNAWTRLTHVGSRVVTPLQFVVPASELRRWREQTLEPDGITWLGTPAEGRSIIISCIFGGQTLPDDAWPGRVNGTQFVTSKVLPNGEKFWLVWQDCPTSEHEEEILRQCAAIQQQRQLVRFAGVPDDVRPGPRMLAFKEFPLDRLLIVMDAAANSASDAP